MTANVHLTAPAATRIYIVHDAEGRPARLVRATHPSTALRHVATDRYVVEVAKQDALIAALQAGATVEIAGDQS